MSSAAPHGFGGRTLDEWLAYQEQIHPQSVDLGLERVRAVATRLGLPQPGGRTAIVGGTNGKGSTATFLAAFARAHGERVGLFTSPHLLRYQERIRIDGATAQDALLVDAFEQIEAARGSETLTFFEFNTLAALLLFRAAAVETTVLEVGLGGRLDATNLVAADVAVLCSVGMDHCDWLGDTLEAIGAEKAGIFRPGQVVVLGAKSMPSTVGAVLTRLACKVQVAGVDFHWHVHADGRWNLHTGSLNLAGLPAPAVPGAIQYCNAACALVALIGLRGPRPVNRAAVDSALRNVRLPGRLQFIPGEVEWVFDVAHNEPAAAVLARELRARPRRGRTIAVFGMLADKDVAAVAAQLDALIDHWFLCALEGPRALNAEQLQLRLNSIHGSVELCRDVKSASAAAASLARPGDRVLVCGSFHTVGPALQARGLY